ncbi:hypothetical protein NXS19_007811 [Fusarium pseudograminearum]|nr:hypothetical protein NXS19_007811 [Fusarium pseudograminearum]
MSQLCPEWRCINRTTNGPVHVCDKGPPVCFGKSWSLFPSLRLQTVPFVFRHTLNASMPLVDIPSPLFSPPPFSNESIPGPWEA